MLNSLHPETDFILRIALRHVVEHVVVELQVLVFRSGNSPIEKINVIALADHVFDETVARAQIQDRGTIHQGENEKQTVSDVAASAERQECTDKAWPC